MQLPLNPKIAPPSREHVGMIIAVAAQERHTTRENVEAFFKVGIAAVVMVVVVAVVLVVELLWY